MGDYNIQTCSRVLERVSAKRMHISKPLLVQHMGMHETMAGIHTAIG